MTKGERSGVPSNSEGKKRAPAPRPRPTGGDGSKRDGDMGVEAFANLRVNDAPVVTIDADGPRPKLQIPAPIGTNASAVPAPLPRAGANGKSERDPDAAAKEKPRQSRRGGKNKASGGEKKTDGASDGATHEAAVDVSAARAHAPLPRARREGSLAVCPGGRSPAAAAVAAIARADSGGPSARAPARAPM